METQEATTPAADDTTLVDQTQGVATEDADEIEALAGADEATQDEGEETAESLEDVEFEGKAYRLPKELKRALLRESDYTRKTTEVAEQRKALDTERAALVQHAETSRALLDEHAKVVAIKSQIDAYKDIDWQAWMAQDQAAAQAARMQYQDLRDAYAEAEQGVQEKSRKLAEDEQRATATRILDGYRRLPEVIPGWNAEVEKQVVSFARSELGFTAQELREATADPRSIKAIYLARLGAESLKTKTKVEKITQAQKTTPAHSLRGTSGKFTPAADTNDFKAFEKMADEKLRRA